MPEPQFFGKSSLKWMQGADLRGELEIFFVLLDFSDCLCKELCINLPKVPETVFYSFSSNCFHVPVLVTFMNFLYSCLMFYENQLYLVSYSFALLQD